MRIRPLIITINLLFLISVLATGVSADDAQRNTFRIGALLSLTGDCADVGEMSRRGIELAIEELNAKGGVLKDPLLFVVRGDRLVPLK